MPMPNSRTKLIISRKHWKLRKNSRANSISKQKNFRKPQKLLLANLTRKSARGPITFPTCSKATVETKIKNSITYNCKTPPCKVNMTNSTNSPPSSVPEPRKFRIMLEFDRYISETYPIYFYNITHLPTYFLLPHPLSHLPSNSSTFSSLFLCLSVGERVESVGRGQKDGVGVGIKFKLTSKYEIIQCIMENFNSSNKKYRKIGPYLLVKPIGKGAYSTVYEARRDNEVKVYAVKQISLINLTQKQQERLHIQIQVLQLIKHKNIVSLVDFKQTSSNLYLVFQYCKHTDLQAHVQKYTFGKLPEDKVRKIAIQIKNAFKVLRANKVVHRDLKLANILVTDEFQIKLADFGFAKLLDDDQFFKSYVGTPLTMAPEIMENRTYNEKCDLWSLGIVIYQLLFGSNPFFTKDKMTKLELKNAIKAELNIPKEISEGAEDLIRKLIVREPNERISFDDFFKHPWLLQDNAKETINEFLLEEALRVQLGKCLLKTTRKKQEKEFVIRKGEDLLGYQIIEHVKNSAETKLMYWVNLGKKIMGFNYYNVKLTFLSLAIILDNIDRFLDNQAEVRINQTRKIVFPKYMGMRDLQKWQMSEYTKRLPNFLQKSKNKMISYLKQLKISGTFSFEASNCRLVDLFLNEILREIENGVQKNQFLATFLKVKPWERYTLELRLQSGVFPQKTLKLLLQKLSIEIENNKMYKKCSQIFQIENLSHSSVLDKIYDNIKFVSE